MNELMKAYSAQFLASRHHLMAFIIGTVRNPTVAEDIFQDVWLRLMDTVNQGQEIVNVPAWCRGVARNLILHYWRDNKRPTLCVDDGILELLDDAMRQHDASSDLWESRRHALGTCIERLATDARHLLRLKYEEGLQAAEIAEQLKRTSASVMMALSRIRQALGDCITRQLGSDKALS